MTRTHARPIAVVLSGLLALAAGASAPAAAAPHSAKLNAEAQGDLRNLAVVEEIYLTDYATYGTFSQLAHGERSSRFRVARGIALAIVHVDGQNGYCLSAKTGSRQYMYDSQAGGLYAGNKCKVITQGRYGGVRRGPTYVG